MLKAFIAGCLDVSVFAGLNAFYKVNAVQYAVCTLLKLHFIFVPGFIFVCYFSTQQTTDRLTLGFAF